ncbi:hypothetical protein KIN20_022473 [Parelaphostrongylus tenuis]|uniref:Uncharacterized protein n=1 Tax=Parelaphostrongylus tenuis TaxID=148309 RepID=A0AAD5MQD5_PARTN|nr:hypothetical protein KIN20_022473 [Parelaphostrongylus tenuis]
MPRSSRPSVLDYSDLQAALDAGTSSSTRDLAVEFGVSKRTVFNKLHQHGFAQKKPTRIRINSQCCAKDRDFEHELSAVLELHKGMKLADIVKIDWLHTSRYV